MALGIPFVTLASASLRRSIVDGPCRNGNLLDIYIPKLDLKFPNTHTYLIYDHLIKFGDIPDEAALIS